MAINTESCDLIESIDDYIAFALYSKGHIFFITIAVPLIAGSGLFGNFGLLLALARFPDLRTITTYYIVNLAIADSFLLINRTFSYCYSYYVSPMFDIVSLSSTFACILFSYAGHVCYFASVFLILMVTFERFLAVCFPLKHLKIKGKKHTITMVTVAWTLSFLLALPAADQVLYTICLTETGNSSNHTFITSLSVCRSLTSWSTLVINCIDITQFVVALISVLVMSSSIVRVLCKRSSMETSGQVYVAKSRIQISRMLIINSLVLFILLTPFEVTNADVLCYELIGISLLEYETFVNLVWIGRVSYLLNSAINPLIYGLLNKSYRNAYVDILCSFFRRRKLIYRSKVPVERNHKTSSNNL